MTHDRETSAANTLPTSLSIDELHSTIHSSGYPLQTFTANVLSPSFNVTEEPTYIDIDGSTERSLDLHGVHLLYEQKEAEGQTILPLIDLFIECKRADLPYVFFTSDRPPRLDRYPLIAGRRAGQDVHVSIDDRTGTHRPLTEALRMSWHEFVTSPPTCLSFSRVHRKGSGFELSGADPFNSVFMPIVKAMKYHHTTSRPYYNSEWEYLRFVFGLCVLDAPMVSVRVEPSGLTTQMADWVRLVRHEPHLPAQDESNRLLSRWAVDVVHKDFLQAYLADHLIPFARTGANAAESQKADYANNSWPISHFE